MATTTGTIVFYDRALLSMFAGLNWTTTSTTFRMGLTSPSYTTTPALNQFYSHILLAGTECATTSYGYTAGGYTMSGCSYTTTGTGASVTGAWDFNDPVWTAAGGSLVAKYYFIYTLASLAIGTGANSVTNHLVAYGLLDSGGGSVTTTDTNTLTVQIDSLGFFTTGIA